jgi:hypothetical protein
MSHTERYMEAKDNSTRDIMETLSFPLGDISDVERDAISIAISIAWMDCSLFNAHEELNRGKDDEA